MNLTVESSAAQKYIDLLQSVINRMASNSAACKTWCLTLVSAVIVFATDKGRAPDSIWVALVPLVLSLFLDSYYLGLERQFRGVYNRFIKKLHAGQAVVEDLYVMSPDGGLSATLSETAKAVASFSIWPFYGLILVMLYALRRWIF